jgi:hypothetical protein
MDNAMWTPLHCAVYSGHEAVARLLLNHGADLSTKTKDGKTPLDLATARSEHGIAAMLRAEAARRADAFVSLWHMGVWSGLAVAAGAAVVAAAWPSRRTQATSLSSTHTPQLSECHSLIQQPATIHPEARTILCQAAGRRKLRSLWTRVSLFWSGLTVAAGAVIFARPRKQATSHSLSLSPPMLSID